MPSISSRPSASLSRTPCADTTGSGGTTAGIGPYGGHTRPRSSSSNSSHNVGVTLLGALWVQPLAARRARARPRVDRDQVRRQRLEARLKREDEAGDAEARLLGQVAGPTGADAPAVDHRHTRLLVERGDVGVANQEDQW